MQTSISLSFGDGTYTFRLTLPGIVEIQRKAKTGIGAVYARVLRGRYITPDLQFGSPLEATYSLEDLRETIRQGLIGGGTGVVDGEIVTVNAQRAQELLETYCFPAAPLSDDWTLSAAILTACVEGYEEPDQKKSPAVEKRRRKKVTRKGGSTTPVPSET